MSDTASHFKNHMMAALEKSLGVDRRFSVASSPWSNGTCERMMLEVVRTKKAIIQEERRNTQDWVELVPAVQWALNTAFLEKIWFHALSCHVRQSAPHSVRCPRWRLRPDRIDRWMC